MRLFENLFNDLKLMEKVKDERHETKMIQFLEFYETDQANHEDVLRRYHDTLKV